MPFRNKVIHHAGSPLGSRIDPLKASNLAEFHLL
jgi:hypothetical protein